jgi:hypothetical protein
MVSKIFFIHQLIRNHNVMWWSYWVLNLNEERNAVSEDHISFLRGSGGRDRTVVGFTTTYAINAYHH